MKEERRANDFLHERGPIIEVGNVRQFMQQRGPAVAGRPRIPVRRDDNRGPATAKQCGPGHRRRSEESDRSIHAEFFAGRMQFAE